MVEQKLVCAEKRKNKRARDRDAGYAKGYAAAVADILYLARERRNTLEESATGRRARMGIDDAMAQNWSLLAMGIGDLTDRIESGDHIGAHKDPESALREIGYGKEAK